MKSLHEYRFMLRRRRGKREGRGGGGGGAERELESARACVRETYREKGSVRARQNWDGEIDKETEK